MKLSLLSKRLLVNLLIGVLLGGPIALLNSHWSLFRSVEYIFYNARFETFRGVRAPEDDVVILAMDEASIEALGTFPWNRQIHADVADKLMQLGARAIAFDISFQAPSPFPASDQLLGRIFKKYHDKILINSSFDYGSTSRVSGSGTGDKGGEVVESVSYIPPMYPDANFGFANYPEDVDGQVRRGQLVKDLHAKETEGVMPSAMTIDQKYEPSFSYQLLRMIEPKKAKELLDKYHDQELLINFAGPPRVHQTVSYSIAHLLTQPNGSAEFQQMMEGKRPEDFFKNKIVFIGSTAEKVHDVLNTPFVANSNVKMPGVEGHVNMFETLRQDIPYSQAPDWLNLLIVLGLGIATSVLLSFFGPLSGLALSLALMVLYSIVNIYFFSNRLFIDWFAPLLTIGLAYTATYAYRFLVEEREKRRIRKFFNSYVSPKLVEELLKDPSTMPSLKSERRMVSMLFSDIAGFTSMSESLPPDEVEHILNEYLTAMSEIVFTNDGTLDKYIGDAVMAVWGNVGPTSPKTDAYKAVNTAIQMQRTLARLREKWLGEGMVPLQIRIGVNTGEALVGNFGSPQKMDYTVIGDAVNTAARLEGLNKEFSTSILISQATYDLVSDRLNARHVGTVKVKGKEEAVSVFEVLNWRDEAAAQTEIRDTKWIKGTNETQWK